MFERFLRGEDLQRRRRKARTGELATLIAKWLDQVSCSPGYYRNLEMYSGRWLTRWRSLADLTDVAVQLYIDERRRAPGRAGEKLSTVSLYKEAVALRRFCAWCISHGWLDRMPAIHPPKPESDYEARGLTAEEMVQILGKLPSKKDHKLGLPAREWFTVCWETSLRPSTVARIRWRDLDLAAATLTIVAKSDKRRFRRLLPLSRAAVAVFTELKPDPVQLDALVFERHDYRAVFRRAAVDAGVVTEEEKLSVRPYDVRHAKITAWLEQTQDIASVMFLAGHKRLQSTEKYLHPSTERARGLVDNVQGSVQPPPKKPRKKS